MATKRSAPKETAARPAKKRQGKVPPILTEALEVLPQADFLKLIKAHVFPGINDESFKPVFQQAIQKFRAKDEIDQLISFKSHQQSINGIAKTLKSSLRTDWHDGYEKQSEFHGEIVGEVEQWLNSLFQVGIERGLELSLVQKCLIFVEGHILAMMNNNCRSPYQDSDGYECNVSDSKGATIYDGRPETVIPYFRRDLLLTALVQDDNTVLSKFKAHKAAGHEEIVSDLLAYIPGPEHKKRCKHSQDEGLYDSWYSADMKAAVPRLRALLKE